MNEFEHVAPQVIPAGLEETEPVPVPVLDTVSVGVFKVKVAVTDRACVEGHDAGARAGAALTGPPGEVRARPPGVAVRVTTVPNAKLVAHVAPQVIPTGLEVTEPDPVPVLDTVRVLSGFRSNVAVTECAASIVTMQVPVPVQPDPVQPVKSEPTSAVAVSVTTAPSPKALEHVAPQSIPAGLEVTEPVPVPVFDTSKMFCRGRTWPSPSARPSIVTTQVPVPEQPAPDHPVNTEPAWASPST